MATFERFDAEARLQVEVLTRGMLVLERDPTAGEALDACTRAARSLKILAERAGLHTSATLAGAMEECFSAAQRSDMELHREQIELLLQALDVFAYLGRVA